MIIILTRNTRELLKECLLTALNQSFPTEILVIDNASTDGTGKELARMQDIRRITFPQPESVAHCWNEGLRYAWSRGHLQALVLNADVELLPKTYLTLVDHLDGCGVLSGVGVDRPAQRTREVSYRPHPDYACFMITKEAHQQVPFDEDFQGAYFEDCDHHIRLHRAGIWAGCISLEFTHRQSSTLKLATRREQERIHLHYDRNKERFHSLYGCYPQSPAYAQLFVPAVSPPLHPAG